MAAKWLGRNGFDESPLLGNFMADPLNGDAYLLAKLFCQLGLEIARSFWASPRIACLALPDLRPGPISLPRPSSTTAVVFDEDYARYAISDAHGSISVP